MVKSYSGLQQLYNQNWGEYDDFIIGIYFGQIKQTVPDPNWVKVVGTMGVRHRNTLYWDSLELANDVNNLDESF